jgi:hypothetical protein
MAFGSDTNWDVRTTGSDSNGGGFNIDLSGIDYSQQDVAQVTYTDLVIGSTNTVLSSASSPFTAAHVGNVINITGGSGFTVQRVQIVGFSSGTVTCDKACGTANSTGGSGKLGGSLQTNSAAMALCVAGNTVWVKAGSYTITAGIAMTSSYWVGYNLVHGDNGASPSISVAARIVPSTLLTSQYVANFAFTTSGSNPCFVLTTGSPVVNLGVLNCSFTGFTYGMSLVGSVLVSFTNCAFISCSTGAVSIAVATVSSVLTVNNSYFANNGVHITLGTGVHCLISNCLMVGATSIGISLGNAAKAVITNCTLANGAATGIIFPQAFTLAAVAVTLISNVIYGHTGWGVSCASTAFRPDRLIALNNAWGANTSGNYTNLFAGNGDVFLTANPFVGGNNYALNKVAGGGASCLNAGFPGVFPGSATTSYRSIGAVEPLTSVSAAGSSFTYVG